MYMGYMHREDLEGLYGVPILGVGAYAHNSMRSTLYVQSLAQAHVHVCTEYCAAFCYLLFFFFFFGLSIAFFAIAFSAVQKYAKSIC